VLRELNRTSCPKVAPTTSGDSENDMIDGLGNRHVEEEGEEWEYASYHQGSKSESKEAHAEGGTLFQSLPEDASADTEEESSGQGSRRYVMGGCPSTHDPCWKQIQAERHRGQHQPPVTKYLLNCAKGAGSYGVVGYLIDAVKLTLEGAVASCALGEL